MPSFEVLADECPPGDECAKIVRRRPGMVTVVGTAVSEYNDLCALGVAAHEGAVDISEELLRAAYAALVGGSS